MSIPAPAVPPEVRAAIEELYARYAACVDSGTFDAWPDFFTETCLYKLQARENFERGLPLALLSFESRAMLKDRVFGITQTLYHQPYYQRHLVSGFLISKRDDGSYAVEANYAVFRTKQGALTDVLNTGRYVDIVAMEQGMLRFRQKLCIYDSELVPNSIIYPI